jgi:pyruvate,water dikinase
VSAGHTRPLEELRRADEREFGGKSASLGELIASEIPVPPGFAVSSSAFQAFLVEAGLEDRIRDELARHDVDDVGSLRSVSNAIREAVRAAPVPEAVREEVTRRYEELAGSEPQAPVAVRSSALGEDSAEATFAGQQETFLWVRGADAVCDALRDCWASLYGAEAISYRARMSGESAAAPAMGVTVQRMVDAEVSGVMFTCNPVSGDPSTVAINASWGLGLAVVGGEVTPDEFRVSKVTREVIQKTIGSKEVEYRPAPEGGGTVKMDVAGERREAACLDEEHLQALVEVARRIEAHFGGHQDVEWATARGAAIPESLFVLQSRPVTTTRKKPEGRPAKSAMSLVMGTFGAEQADDA